MRQLLIFSAVYLVPTFILLNMAVSVLMRNPKRTEHRLLAVFASGYAMLFLSEYFRHMLPLSYSPPLVTYWFGNAGLLVFSTSAHFIFRVSRIDRRLPRLFFPYAFYLPLVPAVLTFVFRQNIINSQVFEQIGIWKYPEFNSSYLITMSAGNVFHVIVIGLLIHAWRKLKGERRRIVFSLLTVAAIVLVWDVVFGYFSFPGIMPPYAYIFGGLFWAGALIRTMYRFDFLASGEKRFATLYDLNPSAILLIDRDGRIESANPAARLLFGTDTLISLPLHSFLAPGELKDWQAHYCPHFTNTKKFSGFETKIETFSGEARYVVVDGDYIHVEQEVYGMLIIRDIHAAKQAEEAVRFLAYHDPLTKLANRRSFYERAGQLIAQRRTASIVVFDLDGFKSVNDTYGHQVGDEFLIHVADVLSEATKGAGFASRVGGDEFYLCLTLPTTGAAAFVENLLATFSEHPYHHHGETITVRASVGISTSPDHANELDALIHKADLAMYDIKKSGKDGYAVYQELPFEERSPV